MTVTFTARLSAATTPLLHAWEHTVGSGRALLALRAEWQAQLQRCHDQLGFRYVRFHGLFALLTGHMGEIRLSRAIDSDSRRASVICSLVHHVQASDFGQWGGVSLWSL